MDLIKAKRKLRAPEPEKRSPPFFGKKAVSLAESSTLQAEGNFGVGIIREGSYISRPLVHFLILVWDSGTFTSCIGGELTPSGKTER